MPTGLKFWRDSIVHRVTPDSDQDAYSQYADKMREMKSVNIAKILEEIYSAHPELTACGTENAQGYYSLPIVIKAALDQRQVGLVAYYGTGVPWFQLTGAWAVAKIELGKTDP